MIIVMIVTLFTSRVILDLLGISDYGINNIINGVIVLFSFLNTALLTATQRFLNFEIGTGNLNKVNTVFCMSMNTYIILSVIVVILGETIGLWFVNNQLNIPSGRMYAAQWVYQFTLIQFILNLLRVPYNASIIAYEKMGFYAYLSMFEALAKLAVCYILYITPFDRLITLSLSHTLITALLSIAYYIYCNKRFITTKFYFFWDTEIFKRIFSFSGWSLFGSMANLSSQQGLNILLNIFFGVTVNAAAGIANQVTNAVNGFVTNFQTAYSPQITKTFAANEQDRFRNLVIKTSKFSFFLLAIFAIPLIICMDEVLNLWLVDVPDYTCIFCQLIMVFLMMDAFMMPMVFAVQATGFIRNYQLLLSFIILMNLPIAYIGLKFGMPPYYVWYVRIFINAIVFLARLWYLRAKLQFPIYWYLKDSLLPTLAVVILSIPLPLCLNIITDGFGGMVITGLVAMFNTSLCIYFVGLNQSERKFVISAIAKKLPLINDKHN